MTVQDMILEFKVRLDRIDTSSLPVFYDEVILIFLNNAVEEIVNEGRRIFEETQVVADQIQSLVRTGTIDNIAVADDHADFYFTNIRALDDPDSIVPYRFFIKARPKVTYNGVTEYTRVKWVQLDDIEAVLKDPFNKPSVYEIPMTFEEEKIIAYKTKEFTIPQLLITFITQPTQLVVGNDCDLHISLHKKVIDIAIQKALESLQLTKQK